LTLEEWQDVGTLKTLLEDEKELNRLQLFTTGR